MIRLLTAAVLVVAVLGVLLYAPLNAFALAVHAFIGGAAFEAYRIFATRGSKPLRLLGVAWSIAITFSLFSESPRVDPLSVLTVGVVVVSVAAIALRPGPEQILDAVQSTAFPVFFVALPLAHLIPLRAAGNGLGQDLVLLLLLCVYLADSAAFYVGSTLGRHRMAPRLSPKKTWEGAIAAFVAAVAGALIAHFWFFPQLGLSHAIVLGVLIGPAGMLGDLLESALKRSAGVKDSSGLLPGHGGLLDRTDSLLFSTPILYYYSVLFLGITP